MNKKMNKLVKMVSVTAALFGSFVPLSSTVNAQESLNIQAIAKGFTQQYWSAVRTGAEQAAEEYNVNLTFVGPANETAVQEQVQMLSNAINQNPDAVVLASLDTNSQIDLLQQAMDQNIPIIGFDSGVPEAPEGSVLATAATDNVAAAGIAAEQIVLALGEELDNASPENPIRIGILSQEANSTSISERTQGFADKVIELVADKENLVDKVAVVGHDKFNNGVSENDAALIIQVQIPANATDAEVLTTAQALLNSENLRAVFASNETASKGIINANDALGGVVGPDGILVAGFDSGLLQKDAVKNNVFIGSVTQDPITIGYSGVELAVKAINGEEVEDLSVEAIWYNSENIESDEVAPLLYD
ncbi:substrate-binding domain-containing protein [Fundicoccus culcitae]|uniref:Substrate-binding domain-containing protein n=1 Tax=Fundicoccus culcitae TaxID=2969821 RepID=A0ABY5P5T8_9LACT|nr:substrate-binding domain-containing protein [Fundicoccus culcitae]UUX33763.1 substrate-binding domain-containing protein [Fundicoccus culcitae]